MNSSPSKTRGHERCGLVFNVQKFSLHDGSGIRTLVFLKGCPLTCDWCSNPEGQSFVPELAFTEAKCIGIRECTYCLDVCQPEAIETSEEGKVCIERNRCDNCGKCAEACPAQALEMLGDYREVDDVLKVVEEDSTFYSRSGGGLTIGGGEPMSQPEFTIRLLETAGNRGIDTAIETCGHCRWEDLERACRHVNQVFFDVKSMDPEKHKDWTGVSNRLLLENLRKLCRNFPHVEIVVRTPVVPGFNDTEHDIQAIVDFLDTVPGSFRHELLPYHTFGESKYSRIGKRYRMSRVESPKKERIDTLNTIARASGRLVS
ncbi:MAG: glycyl-radical enzyme activating protein [Proteobacteria bacterium]|nr:glycyl-radical enzyme activating protein [Pseudomonadota bacterium]